MIRVNFSELPGDMECPLHLSVIYHLRAVKPLHIMFGFCLAREEET